MFVGQSLTNIRILHDLSRSQLAEKVGVTEQAIWQYENGYVSPKLEVVNKLKAIFNVKSGYFYHNDLIAEADTNSIQVEHIAYRSESIHSLAKSQSESMHMRFLDAFLNKVEKKITYPKNILLELRNESIDFLLNHPAMDRELQIKHIAELARNKIGLEENTNKHLLFLFERAGAFIFEKEIGESIDAYSLWSKEDRPYIVLGSIKKSAVRRNFDLAHELGHLLLHYKVEFTMQDKKTYRMLEDEANLFASMFLLPEKEFRSDMACIGKVSNPDAYIEMKQKWEVSIQAMAIRAFKLNEMNYQQYRYFFMSINKKKYKHIEPLDYEIPISHPTKIMSILQLLFEKGILSVSHLMDEMRVDQRFLTVLTGITEDFFSKHRQNEKQKCTVDQLGLKLL